MPKDAEITRENNRADIPQPVRLALNVLAGLEQERAKKLRRALPAYAMTLARQGRAVTEQVLHDALAKGDETVMGPRPAFTKAAETIEQRYNRIVDKWPKPENLNTRTNSTMPLNDQLVLAASRGDLARIEALVEQDVNRQGKYNDALIHATLKGHLEVVQYLSKHRVDIRSKESMALCFAAESGHIEIVRHLTEHGADIRVRGDEPLHRAAAFDNFKVIRYLTEHGADLSCLSKNSQKKIKLALENMNIWMKKTGTHPPAGLEDKTLGSFDPDAVNVIGSLILKEGYFRHIANHYAYPAVRLFDTAARVMDYLEKWAKPGKQPLHDVVQMISVPNNAPDLKSWASAVMEHGPEMAKLVKFADKLPQPVRSVNGKGWSLTKTRAETAKFAFTRGSENPELAALFNKHSKTEDSFNTALKIVKKHKGKKHSRIPEITIDGETFGLPSAVFKKLPDGDYRGLILGELTACCQSIGGAGEDCAEHGFTSENGGFYIVAVNDNKRGEEIIGQSWAWRGKKGELVLDSLETLGDRIKPEQWTKLAQEFAKALKTTDVTALHIGKGGDTPKNMPFEIAPPSAQPVDYDGYRDSERQYRVFRK